MTEKTEEIKRLKDFLAKPVVFEVVEERETFWGNFDDEEDSKRDEIKKDLSYRLENIYLKDSKLAFVKIFHAPILLPFHYHYTPVLDLRRYCEQLMTTISKIRTNGLTLKTSLNDLYWLFDGYGRVTPDGERYTQEDVNDGEKYPKGPLLKKLKCAYNLPTHQITGEIEKLLENCFPLF